MAAIVRVKRKVDFEPSGSLIVSCKRQRNASEDDPDELEIKSTLKFAGTVSNKTEKIVNHIRTAIRKEKLEKEYKQHNVDILSKSRRLCRATSEKKRYLVVASRRALVLDCLDKDEELTTEPAKTDVETDGNGHYSKKVYCLYDVEQDLKIAPEEQGNVAKGDEITCNSVPLTTERAAAEDYVYDLYYVNKKEFDFQWLENALAVELYAEDVVCDRDDFCEDEEEVYEDDDDSNDEGNWRNDYPEEDPHFYDMDSEYDGDDESNSLANYLSSCVIGDENLDEENFASLNCDNGSFDLGLRRSYDSYKKQVMKDLLDDEADEYSED